MRFKAWIRLLRERHVAYLLWVPVVITLMAVSILLFSVSSIYENSIKNDRIQKLNDVVLAQTGVISNQTQNLNSLNGLTTSLIQSIDCRSQIAADTAVKDYLASIGGWRTWIAYFRALIAYQAGTPTDTAGVAAFVSTLDEFENAVNGLQATLEVRQDAVVICKNATDPTSTPPTGG